MNEPKSSLYVTVKCFSCGKKTDTIVAKNLVAGRCRHCGNPAYKASTSAGSIYVLSSMAHPDRLKIGMTRGCPFSRAAELSRPTGVSGRFTVEAIFFSRQPDVDEQKIHKKLASKRVLEGTGDRKKEFFKCSATYAYNKIKPTCKNPIYLSKQLAKDAQESLKPSIAAEEVVLIYAE